MVGPAEEGTVDYVYDDIAGMIDHSLLQPTLTTDELEEGCRLALDYRVASVCILPYALKRCAELLAGSTVQPTTTVGFPHGGHATRVKVAEADQALTDGGTELDMVVNVSKVLSGDWDYVRDDIRAVLEPTHGRRMKLKVKTSTGYGRGGATDEDVVLMRRHSPAYVQVKAAGGIRDLDRLLRVRELGCSRCGASRTRDILDELKRRLAAA
jgi:deoxyribose-phosphate aldolase